MNFVSVLMLAFRRLWNNKGLTLCSILGLVTAVSLITSIPLYTDAANFKVLQEQLSTDGQNVRRVRPPFAFMYRYIGAWHGAVELEEFEAVNEYMVNSVPGILTLPMESYARYIKTDNFSMFPASEADYIGIRQPLGWVNIGVVDNIQENIHILEGSFPQPVSADAQAVPAMVSYEMAEETGVQVGEQYVIFQRNQSKTDDQGNVIEESQPVQFTIEVAGVWSPIDADDTYWFYNPKSLSTSLLVPEETFKQRVAPVMEGEVYAAIWYLIFNGDAVRTDDVPELVGRINYANTRVGTLLPNTVLDISPQDALEEYQWTTFVMTISLYVFSIPILGLVLYFIAMISGLVVERQRGEIAILKSRGAGDMQVLGIYTIENVLIGIIGLAGGILIGKQLAIVMGNTVSFLEWGSREALPVVITPRAIRMGLIGIGISLLASLMPAMQAARLTIVTYKQDRARSMQKPFWQRYFVDLFLLIPAGYGYYTLQNRGTINFLDNQAGGDPFSDPLMFLVPSLTIVAGSLIVVRVFPMLMELLAWFTSQVVKSVSVVLALRHLARVTRQYIGALLLLILTLSLATFTASMARTLDQSLTDRMYYKYGGDYFLSEAGESNEADDSEESSDSAAEEIGGWVFVPVSEHQKVDGINDAIRVGSYPAEANIAKSSSEGRFYGVDRMEFPKVSFWRRDFAYSDLGGLMNRLALDSTALLVSPNFLWDHSLNVGDRVELQISIWGERRNIEFLIADTVTYFPTYYPDDEDTPYLFVGNLEYVFEMMGGVYPYDVWITTDPDIDTELAEDQLMDLDIRVVSMRGSREAIELEQKRPERTGVFGILSVGFIAAALLTMLGFLLHALISFRRRYIEFGVLRAIGLSVGQMISFLGLEQFLLIAAGILAGTGVGVGVSRVFIPFLQVGTDEHIGIPPFRVLIAWEDMLMIYGVFVAMLLVAVAGMIWFLMHLKIFEAVKLGEAV